MTANAVGMGAAAHLGCHEVVANKLDRAPTARLSSIRATRETQLQAAASRLESRMLASPIPLVLAAALLQWVADNIPTFNVEPSCRAAAKMGDSLSLDTSLRQCLADENGARAQLENQWARYSQALRQRCTATAQTGGNPSYVELLVCLQMGRDASQMDRAPSGNKRGD